MEKEERGNNKNEAIKKMFVVRNNFRQDVALNQCTVLAILVLIFSAIRATDHGEKVVLPDDEELAHAFANAVKIDQQIVKNADGASTSSPSSSQRLQNNRKMIKVAAADRTVNQILAEQDKCDRNGNFRSFFKIFFVLKL